MKYLTEAVIGLGTAAIIAYTSAASVINIPFIYQGF
jgi:hypothetical protein